MKRLRRTYYDLFARVYDRVIALHSRDAGASARDFLVRRSDIAANGSLLDLCTGTGAVAIRARQATGPGGLIVGVDFSVGMIRRAREKARRSTPDGIAFVVADAACLPFRAESFDVVTCSHAMYELRPSVRDRVLREAQRVLRPGGRFLMMEHCEPTRPVARLLYRIRLAAVGSSGNRDFARDEVPFLRPLFSGVECALSDSGRSKVIVGAKPGTG
ncbi:MAG: class I SAM-dependent methyltransferase [Thiohalocapsa sp.]|jgi:demethylmenaquinone methyltransferase/2-methoxy-6-polyprenyl-1,4-benzoquinol methylase